MHVAYGQDTSACLPTTASHPAAQDSLDVGGELMIWVYGVVICCGENRLRLCNTRSACELILQPLAVCQLD